MHLGPLFYLGYEDARQKYLEAMNTLGYQADLAYNTALCYFKDKHYIAALKHVGELVMESAREVPSKRELVRPHLFCERNYVSSMMRDKLRHL